MSVLGSRLANTCSFRRLMGGSGSENADRSAPTPAQRPARDELLSYDAVGLAELVGDGEVSRSELLEATIRRMERLEGSINALTTSTFQRARQRLENDECRGPFAGVPFIMKDIVDVAGVRRSDGAGTAFHRVPAKSAPYVDAIERAGLNIVGMSNMPEFATLPVTRNLEFGTTYNPWDLMKASAGSSGGAAAAVAAGYVPVAHGSDGTGSIRMPASFCGLFGMKPSRDRILSGESDGHQDFMKHHHVISRTVRDSAALFAVTEDARSSAKYLPLGMISSPSVGRLRIGVTSTGLFGIKPDEAVADALQCTAKLCTDLGHHVEEIAPPPIDGEEFFNHVDVLFMSHMLPLVDKIEARSGRSFEASKVLTPMTKSMGLSARGLPSDALNKAQAYFEKISVIMSEYFSKMDVWLTPVTPTEPPRFDVFDPSGDWERDRQAMREFMCYMPIMNITGAPAMSVPLSWSPGGLPVGSHFSASPGNDGLLLKLAFELEQARPWKHNWAPTSAAFV